MIIKKTFAKSIINKMSLLDYACMSGLQFFLMVDHMSFFFIFLIKKAARNLSPATANNLLLVIPRFL